MADRSLQAPPSVTVDLSVRPGEIQVRSTRLGRLRARLGGAIVGAIFAGMFGLPAWQMAAEGAGAIGLQLLLGGIGLAGALLSLWSLTRRLPWLSARLTEDGLTVEDGPEHLLGHHRPEALLAIVDTELARTSQGGQAREGPRALGLHVAGRGTLGVVLASQPEALDELADGLEAVLGADGRALGPRWATPPVTDGLATGPRGAPAGWPEHPRIGVVEEAERTVLEVPAPGWRAQVPGYARACLPVVVVTAGLVLLGWLQPGTGWAPWAMLADGDLLAAGIVGTWLMAGLVPAWRRARRVHGYLSTGPHQLVVEAEHLALVARGRAVLATVETDQVAGLAEAEGQLELVVGDQTQRLPSAGLAAGERAWLAQGLAYALAERAGRRLPEVSLAHRKAAMAGDRPG